MATYVNPVFRGAAADPFVLKHRGEYWAFCTGFSHDGRCFPVLHSPDLVHWEPRGAAMTPLPGGHTCYWAPEVSFLDGRFHLYYSVGNEERMTLRVAVAPADRPGGPYADAGRALTREEFAIDPHVFVDDDGRRYLFYATDFLTHSHVGTGTVFDELQNPLTLAGRPRPVSRARYDWQVYDPARREKGGVRWHTVEGPFVLKRKGRYHQMFSAGNWKDVTYGVSEATTDDLARDGEWDQLCDGATVLPLLRTIPGEVIGPGHNSVVRGPDNRQLYCVYHRWDRELDTRVLAFDRLEAIGGRLHVLGPTTGMQPAPDPPWSRARLEVPADGARVALPPGPLLLEATLGGGSAARVAFTADGEEHAAFDVPEAGGPAAADVLRLLRVELDAPRLSATLDGRVLQHTPAALPHHADALVITPRGGSLRLDPLELTPGFQDLFENPPLPAGWRARQGGEVWRVEDGALVASAGAARAVLARETTYEDGEVVVNGRLLEERAAWGVFPAYGPAAEGPLVLVRRAGGGFAVEVHEEGAVHRVAAGPPFDGARFEQLRFRREAGRLAIFHGLERIHETASAGRAAVALAAEGGRVAFDEVRLTVLRREGREE